MPTPQHPERGGTARESAEIPSGLKIVIADDNFFEAGNNERAIKNVIPNTPHPEIIVIRDEQAQDNLERLFVAALGLDNGRPADIVILDDKYRRNHLSWQTTQNRMAALAQKAEIDIDHLTTTDPDFIPPALLHDLYGAPSSVSLALWLRVLGFEGKIFVVSNTPPFDANTITTQQQALNEHLAQTQHPLVPFPIDGFSQKMSSGSGDIRCSCRIKEDGNWADELVKGNLSNALHLLFSAHLNQE